MKNLCFLLLTGLIFICSNRSNQDYLNLYQQSITQFLDAQQKFLEKWSAQSQMTDEGAISLKRHIGQLRIELKKNDFWLRYYGPIEYKKINGPLAKEWESESFEKFEKPYLRLGAGLTLLENYLDEENAQKDSVQSLISSSISGTKYFLSDSIRKEIAKSETFFLANRMYLLNLASIYTTSFECPDTSRVIPELIILLKSVQEIYTAHNLSFPEEPILDEYMDLYRKCLIFCEQGNAEFSNFNRFAFIKKFVDPLFTLNQKMIKNYKASSISYNEFALSNDANSIFDKSLYESQDRFGVFRGIKDSTLLRKVYNLGKLFFFDPIFSGNTKRSCASCHKPLNYYTDTTVQTSKQFDPSLKLARNTPTLLNVHLSPQLMLDGRHQSIFDQFHEVINNPQELNTNEKDILKKILSCKEYFLELKYITKSMGTSTIRFEHIASVLNFYIGTYSGFYSTFDRIMSDYMDSDNEIVQGFNLFMGKALCGTCHYVPGFGGIKAPFISNEFEVVGVPQDTSFSQVSRDSGRFAQIMDGTALFSFRTPTLRNVAKTKPYMHNGIFHTLEEVIEFYNDGGGNGRGLNLANQTLMSEKLNLTALEKRNIIHFLESLSEDIGYETVPATLPTSSNKKINKRYVGGVY